MKINAEVIAKYIESYFNRIFKEKIRIDVTGSFYELNKKLRIPIYRFWEYSDNVLLEDFDDLSLKGDYIGTIFFFLSGYWEYIHDDVKDKYGRFPAIESFQYEKGVLEEPVVEIMVERIKDECNLKLKEKEPKILITHDIDILALPNGFSFCKSILGDIFKRRNFKLALEKMIMKTKNVNPISVENLVKIHKNNGTKGIFFFMPRVQRKITPGGYDIWNNTQYLRKLVREIKSVGCYIGIHYDTRYLIEDLMSKDKRKLENVFQEKIKCGRAHFLLFDIKRSFEIYEKSGIKIDSTGGFADKVGFRFGTCRPFKPFNFKDGKEYDIIEMPLIVMDGTLKSEKYMKLSPEEGFSKIEKLMKKVEKYNGVFTLLWHNSSFFHGGWKEWEWVYHETLKNTNKKNFEYVTCNDIIKVFDE